jgi:hypothetical protein
LQRGIDESAERLPALTRAALGGDQQLVGDRDRGVHDV